ncbi:DNRLRE domain-containing protein [Gottfriedia sp. NPDC058432]|uniref:DNRLRE domain-containing protein n=1 Tax=Gottfriedia sp. NPDC058432 TaxID=3346497 RepID=UPI003657F78B
MWKLNFKNIFTILVLFSLLFASLPIKIFAEEIKSGISTNSSDEIETKIPIKDADADNIKTDPTSSNEPRVGEIVEDRTVNTKTYYNGNGKYTKKIYFEPVNLKEPGEKTLEEISPDLVKDESTKNIITTENTAIDTDFLKSMSNGKYANFTYKGHSMSLSILQAAGENKQTLLADDVEATFEESSNKIVHKGIFPQIDLQNYTFNQNTKEDLVLHQYNGYHIFKFKIQTDLKATIDDVGNIQMKDENDKKVFELPKPNMSDSNYDKGSGDSATSNNVKYDIQETEDGYILTLNADPDWLASPERVFPIFIDPTTSVTNSSDSFLMSAYPTTNYSSTSSKWDSGLGEYILKIGNYDSTTGTCYAFINQSLPNLAGVTVTSANFNAYVTHTASASATGIWLDRITESWSNSTVTWNTKPDSVNLTSDTVGKDQWASFDITGTVKSWLQGTQKNYGLKLHTNGNGQSYWKKIVSTSNSNNNPYISVNYSIPVPPKPEVTKVISNGNQTGYINLDWDPIPGATGYNVWIYNGKEYEKFPVGTATSFTTQNKGIWPTKLNATKKPDPILDLYQTAGTGGQELPTDPAYLYQASGGVYPTNKNYWFRISAIYPLGESVMSNPSTPTIPDLAKPAKTTSKSYTFGNQTGYFDISWSKVTGATGYKVWFFNGKEYEQVYDTKADVTSYSTKDLKVWPKPTETGRYKLHLDNTGVSFAINPSVVYTNAAGGYEDRTYYYIKISAYNEDGDSLQSDAEIKYIPSLTTPPPPNGDVYANELASDYGYASLTWDSIPGATGYKVWVFNGKFYEPYDVKNTTSWTTKGKGIWPTDAEIANADPTKTQVLHQDGKGTDLPREPFKLYSKMGTTYATSLKFYFRVSAYNSQGETVYSTNYFGSTMPLEANPADVERLGLEDYWTYGSHKLGDGQASVNVTNGNIVAIFGDASLYTRGILGYRMDRTYNSQSSRVSALGKGWTFTGDESLQEVKKGSNVLKVVYVDEDATKHEFLYDTTASQFISPKGKYLTLNSNTINSQKGYELTDKTGFKKQFEAIQPDSGKYRINRYQDKFNNTIGFVYDSSNRLIKVSELDADGSSNRKSINFSYSGTSNLIESAQFVDKKYTYHYNSDQTLKDVIITDEKNPPRLLKNEFLYDSTGKIISFKDAKNIETLFSYPTTTSLQINEQVDGESSNTVYDFSDKDSYSVKKNDEDSTTYTRDTQKNTYAIAKVENEVVTENEYDENYNVKQIIRDDKISKFTFDNWGNELTNTDPDNNITTNVYDTSSYHNLLNSENIDSDGTKTTTSYIYDPTKKWIESITNSDGKNTYEVDKYGRNTKLTNPDGSSVITVYDDSTNKTTVTDESNHKTETTYSEYGDISSTTDAVGNKTNYVYDILKTSQLNSIKQPKGDVTSFTYDDQGNFKSIIDGLGRLKSFTYDSSGKIQEYSIPVSDQRKITVKYYYDEQGNQTKQILNSSIEKRYVYDADTQQLTNVGVYKDNIKQTGWDYVYENDLLKTIQFGNLKKEFLYNENNDIDTFSLGNFKQNYIYDLENVLQSIKTLYQDSSIPFTKLETFQSDEDGKVKHLEIKDENNNVQMSLDTTNDSVNNKNTLKIDNNLNRVVQYNSDENVDTLTFDSNSKDFALNYQYYSNGYIKGETVNGVATSYQYDKNQQIEQENLPDGTIIKYTYDDVGNRTKREISKTGEVISIDSYGYNDANQINNKNSDQYTYDLDGNLLQDEKYKYNYNEVGQLSSIDTLSGQNVASYQYDEENQRTSKTIGNKVFEYYYKDSNLSLEVIKENNSVIGYRYYVYNNDRYPLSVIWKQKNGQSWNETAYYYITNHHGNVLSMIDKNGQEVASYTYDSFGNVLASNGSLSEDNPIRYAGYYYDSETKHYYLNARYYNPSNGAFQALDPILPINDVNPLSQNGYIYSENDPINKTDSDGKKAAHDDGYSGWQKIVYSIEKQMLLFSDDAYRKYKPNKTLNNGWVETVRPNGYKGADGFFASIYRKKLSNGKYDYVIAYRGTQSNKWPDVKADEYEVIEGHRGSQSNQAVSLAKNEIKKDKKSINKIYFTGHSLGGYLASFVESEVVDGDLSAPTHKAYTYNAPGFSASGDDENVQKLKRNKKGKYKKYIINYRLDGDPVSFLMPYTLGTKITIKPTKKFKDKMKYHYRETFKETWGVYNP